VELRAEQRGPELRVTVVDSGRWRDPDPDPGARGHGLRLMAAIADAVAVDRRPDGTTVTLVWGAAGPP
jgi:anti-sigma regulatory factor (Ser/Thr protein kinase)